MTRGPTKRTDRATHRPTAESHGSPSRETVANRQGERYQMKDTDRPITGLKPTYSLHECYWCAKGLPHPPRVHVRLKGPTHIAVVSA